MTWPPCCCVPAFLERAILELGEVRQRRPLMRAELARACNVSVPLGVDNPFGLPVSDDPTEWGATPTDALNALPVAQAMLGATRELTMTLQYLDQIVYQMYEVVILDRPPDAAVIGLGFDYRHLATSKRAPEPPTLSQHLVRLTPAGDESLLQPNVRSADFRLDYSGDVHVFDDSGEVPACAELSWIALTRAARRSGGAFWVVEPLAADDFGQTEARVGGSLRLGPDARGAREIREGHLLPGGLVEVNEN